MNEGDLMPIGICIKCGEEHNPDTGVMGLFRLKCYECERIDDELYERESAQLDSYEEERDR